MAEGAGSKESGQAPAGVRAGQSPVAEEGEANGEGLRRTVLEELTELIARFKPDGTLIYVNEVFCRFFGKAARQLLGTRWHPIAVEDDVPGIERQLQHLSPAAPVVTIVNRVCSGTGEVRWMQFVNRGIFDSAGRLVEAQAVGRDITEHRRIEEALRVSEARFRVALAGLPILVFNQDRELRYTWIANPALGVRADDCLGRTDEELLGADSSAPLTAIKRRVLRTGIGVREEVCVRRQGQEGYFDLMVEPQRGADGQVTGIICAALDITPRKQMENALRESERRFLTVFEASPQPIGLSRLRDGVFLEVNEAFARLHGYARQEIVGQTSAQLRLWHTGNRERVMRRLTRSPGGCVVEMQARRRDGRIRDLLASLQLVEMEGEKCILGVLIDITERKRVAAKLSASERTLRTLVSRLESVREEERRKLAREIHDTFGHALTDWKFDLAWLDRQLQESGFHARTPLRRRVKAMSDRVGTEMDAARRIASALRPALLDTLGLLPAIEALARDFGRQEGIPCPVTGPSAPIPIDDATAVALFRIAQELLTNVKRHAHARAVTLELEVESGWIQLRVADDGRGISPRVLRARGGLGLLGIRERAGLLGGQIAITGRRNRGTVVTVRFPLKTGKE